MLPSQINGGAQQQQQQQGEKKTKKPKNKVPKGPSGAASARNEGDYGDYSGEGGSSYSHYESVDPDYSAYTAVAGAGTGDHSGGSIDPLLQQQQQLESAGPIEDWGFVYNDTGNAANGTGRNGPELEYSDDEDFESAEDIISSSQFKNGHSGPHPPGYNDSGDGAPRKKGKKKKTKGASNGGGSNSDDFEQGPAKSVPAKLPGINLPRI
jgi:hypothetical protein